MLAKRINMHIINVKLKRFINIVSTHSDYTSSDIPHKLVLLYLLSKHLKFSMLN